MNYVSTLIAVKNMEKSKAFYSKVLGLKVISDFGANVTLSGGLSLQTIDTWQSFINKNKEDIAFKNNCGELYFEEDDIESFYKKLDGIKDTNYVHKLIEHSWGQRVVRFYDPDGHIIEVGENMKIVVKRFLDSGLSIEEAAKRMDVPISYIESVK